jgi:SIR2-like domain
MLADDVHIEQIRTALWRGREYGRSAVLIGAGFSRNARPARTSPKPFPLWGELASMLIDQLYPASSSPDWIRGSAARQAESISGALRLAQEFEAAHGRQRLDQLIKDSIADKDWGPGKVHRQLMELPWSDVFTTNYDTLLERAAAIVPERKYEIVYTMSQIPSATRPRIVKLHGSFPATYPFIVTEEDFRTYPRQFAPFVNLVQQSMMENVFCLVGFSGDDPNFLYWSGWVRDQLGRSAPTIYLCGLLDLNAPKRQLLHERRVTPVDLSPIFPRQSYPDPQERHLLAMEWFLLNLEAGRRPDPLLWPQRVPIARTEPSPRMPPLLPSTITHPRAERMSPNEPPGTEDNPQ